MKFIDTHLHLQDYKQKCATDIVSSARRAGVEKLVCAAVVEKDWGKIAALTENYPGEIIPAFGLHPWYVNVAEDGWEQRLAQYLERFPQALIGETGLDYFRDKNSEPQNRFFKQHIDLAKQFRRPLIIHAVRAQGALSNYWRSLPPKFVLHSYNGKTELLKQAVKFGGYISFSPSILRKTDAADVIRAVPVERLLLETDGPFAGAEELAPDYIPQLFNQLAVLCGGDSEALSARIYQNSLEFIKSW